MTERAPPPRTEVRLTPNGLPTRRCDVLIVGAGPAGLTAAVYLARFRRKVVVIDAGHSRALRIPKTHNFPGFPSGISGPQFLHRLRQQALRHGVRVQQGTVESLSSTEDGFLASAGEFSISAKRVLLATGVVDKLPVMEGIDEATLATNLRWCPICDGFEVIDQRVAVLSDARHGPGHALFMRTYTADVTLLLNGSVAQIEAQARRALEAAGIVLVDGSITKIEALGDAGVSVTLYGGDLLNFAVLYPMLGSTAQDRLGTALGARCSDGELLVEQHQETTVPGLYAAGDVVKALNQMSVGVGHAAVAATAIHNSLKGT